MSQQSQLLKNSRRTSQSLNRITGNDKNSKSVQSFNKDQSLKNSKLPSNEPHNTRSNADQSRTVVSPSLPEIQGINTEQSQNRPPSNLLSETKSVEALLTHQNQRVNSTNPDLKGTERSQLSHTASGSHYFNPRKLENDDDGSKYYGEMHSLYKTLVYKAPNGSRYQSDFVRHPVDLKSPKVNNNPWETFRIEQPIDFNTTSRNTYVNWKKPAPERNYIDLWKATEDKIPFAGKSSYKNEFLDWGKSQAAIEKPIAPKTVIGEMPFIGNSSYRETYKPPENVTQAGKIDHNLFGKKSPLAPNVPMLTESVTHKTYQPFKVQPLQKVRPRDEVEFQPATVDQYRTTYGSEFINFNKSKEKVFTHKYKITML